MIRNLILIGLLVLQCFVFCHDKNTNEPLPDNTHPQVDFPWPSLADSPWPIAHGNMQCNGRSPFKGPQEGNVSWYFSEEGMLDLMGSPVIGEEGTIYFTSCKSLYALNPNGTLKWKFTPGRYIISSPMIGAGEIIYFSSGHSYDGSNNGNYYAVNSDGTVRWEFNTNSSIYNYGEAIDLAGNIYFPDVSGILYSLNSEGSLNWQTSGLGGFQGGVHNSIAMSPEGHILYIAGRDSTLNAVSTGNAEILWRFPLGYVLESAPLVDCQGNIYCFGFQNKQDGYIIYSIKPNSEIRWSYENIEVWNLQVYADMHMDINGNIYFCKNNLLVSLDYKGKLRWEVPIDDGFFSPILGDCHGNIFLTAIHHNIYGFNNSGTKLFDCEIETHSWKLVNGAISANGHLYISESLNLYCIN